MKKKKTNKENEEKEEFRLMIGFSHKNSKNNTKIL